MELSKSGAGNHVSNFGEAAIAAHADTLASEAHPDFPAALLYRTRERAVVNHFTSNRRETADAFECFAAQQNAAARRTGGASLRVGDPSRRIEHQEKKEKWRNQKAFSKRIRL